MDNLHDVTQNAVAALASRGISSPQQMPDIEIHSDYSRIPNQGEGNIGDKMGAIASYLQYLEYCVSLAEVDYEAWLNSYEFQKKRTLLSLPTERRDISEARAEQQHEQLKTQVMQKYSTLKLLKSILEGKKRIADSLSRELSRRSLVLQMSRSMA